MSVIKEVTLLGKIGRGGGIVPIKPCDCYICVSYNGVQLYYFGYIFGYIKLCLIVASLMLEYFFSREPSTGTEDKHGLTLHTVCFNKILALVL